MGMKESSRKEGPTAAEIFPPPGPRLVVSNPQRAGIKDKDLSQTVLTRAK